MNDEELQHQFTQVIPARPEMMSDATWDHWQLVRQHPMYWETRMWYPIRVSQKSSIVDVMFWLEERGLVRGTTEARNDWLHPWKRLFLFKDEAVAVECLLKWG